VKMEKNELERSVTYGAGLTFQGIDDEFKILYDDLLQYKEKIFTLVEHICLDCDAQERLAFNIAKRDGKILQRLVAKECEKRRMNHFQGTDTNKDLLDVSEKKIIKDLLNERALTLEKTGDFIDAWKN